MMKFIRRTPVYMTLPPPPLQWIFWETTKWNQYPLSKSPVALYIGGMNSHMTNTVAALFRCPMDMYDTERNLERMESPSIGLYYFSYSMSSYGLGLGGQALGLFSTYVSGGGAGGGTFYPFKSSAVRHTSQKIMLAEEQTSDSASQLGRRRRTHNFLNVSGSQWQVSRAAGMARRQKNGLVGVQTAGGELLLNPQANAFKIVHVVLFDPHTKT